jgi:hypothetical protein
MSKRPTALCHICGEVTQLSFEHVPPHAAFNDRPLLHAHIKKLFRGITDLDSLSGKVHQKGAGGYTLCERCNNQTGHWYGSAFVEWAYQGMQIVQGTKCAPSLIYNFHIFPLRIIKQVVCMFFSANSPHFRDSHLELVKFVLDRDARYLPSYARVYAFYTLGDRSRSAGVTGLLKGVNEFGGSIKSFTFSEVTFPPFGFLMTLESPTPDDRLLDISEFSHFAYSDWRTVSMKLPIMPIYTPYPSDYRSREQVRNDAAKKYGNAESD